MFCIGNRNLSKHCLKITVFYKFCNKKMVLHISVICYPMCLPNLYIIFETIFLECGIYNYFTHLMFSFLPTVKNLLVNLHLWMYICSCKNIMYIVCLQPFHGQASSFKNHHLIKNAMHANFCNLVTTGAK